MLVDSEGETPQRILDMLEKNNIPRSTYFWRVANGWSKEKAATKAPRKFVASTKEDYGVRNIDWPAPPSTVLGTRYLCR
jgi:hypothetical protein